MSAGRAMSAIGVIALVVGVLATHAGTGDDSVRAKLRDGSGNRVGTVRFEPEDGMVEVSAVVYGVSPGFHGFHVHTVGSCVAPSFTSAGGHFNPASATHAGHAGDMPVLLVNSDGTGRAKFITDHFRIRDLFDTDGSAVVLHAGADNFANIPGRYSATGPDATTFATGDAGARFACGEVRR